MLKIIGDKDLQIHSLQKEIEELRQNEKDYQDLNFLLSNLEHRYNLLKDEKVRSLFLIVKFENPE